MFQSRTNGSVCGQTAFPWKYYFRDMSQPRWGNVTGGLCSGEAGSITMSSTVGSLISFHMMLLLFLPSLGTILKGGRVGSKWELADFFFLCDMNTLPIPPSSGPVFALFLLLTSMRKQTGNFCAGWDSCTISSNSGLGSFWTFSHACTTHQVPHTCAKTVGSLKI